MSTRFALRLSLLIALLASFCLYAVPAASQTASINGTVIILP